MGEGDDPVRPLVPVSDGMDSARELLISVAGTIANAAILATVAALIIGAILWGTGVVLQRPGLSQNGVQTIVGAVACAIVAAGLNTWIAWFGQQAISIWN
ncbi:hypothetical protein GCM10009592_27800 [Brachybacterium rhamnosum]|uniref:Integral membrane protein n=1 Tax=Brachybacterium rhamnosum TaxID=173361 RepID=A0ABW4Q039_9MICO